MEIFKSLRESTLYIRSANLRAIINAGSVDKVIGCFGYQILEWLREKATGLGSEEALRLMAMIMRVQGNKQWYDPSHEGNYHIHCKYILLINSVITFRTQEAAMDLLLHWKFENGRISQNTRGH